MASEVVMGSYRSGGREAVLGRTVVLAVVITTWLFSSPALAQNGFSVTQLVNVVPVDSNGSIQYRLLYTFNVQGVPAGATNVFVTAVLPHGTYVIQQAGCSLTGQTMTCPVVSGQASMETDAWDASTVVSNAGAFAYGPGVFVHAQAEPLSTNPASAPPPGPTISGFSPQSAAPGQTVTITGTFFLKNGSQTPLVTFGTNAPISSTWVSSTQLTAPAPGTAGTYTVTVTNPDGQYALAGQSLVVTSALSPPSGLVVTVVSLTQVHLSWNSASGADHYQIERRNAPGAFNPVTGATNVRGLTYDDGGLGSPVAYLYRVRAADAAGNLSTASNNALATTVVFSTLTPGITIIDHTHIQQLRAAIEAVGRTAGVSVTWPTDSGLDLTNVTVKAQHVIEMRTNCDNAMGALGLLQGGWAAGAAQNGPILATHFREIQLRVN